MTSRSLREEILARCVEDWVYAAEVLDVARRAGVADPEAARATAIGLIAELISLQLVVAGDVIERGHVPWKSSPGEAILRITTEWLRGWPHTAPPPGAVVWLDTTEAGERIGREVIARE